MMSAPFGDIGAEMASMLIRTGVSRQCGCDGFARRGIVLPSALGRKRTRFNQLSREIAYLLKFGGEQAADLFFERSNAGDLPHARRDAERKQIARDIEST